MFRIRLLIASALLLVGAALFHSYGREELGPAEKEAHRKELRSYALTAKSKEQSSCLICQLGCTACHSVGGGETIGPDLADVGSRLSREEIIDQILEPSRRAKDREVLVTFNDGKSKSFRLLEEKGSSLIVLDTDSGEKRVLLKDDLDDFKVGGTSNMPEGLVDKLSKEDFAKLVNYLESRKK